MQQVLEERWKLAAELVGHFLRMAAEFRGVSHFPLGKMGISSQRTGGTVMQCQKLKTYMETGRVVFLPSGRIRANPAQPRTVFEEAALAELSESIREHGILQPLSVRRVGNTYELIAGERRLRAARLVGLSEIPCIVMSMDEKESAMAAMVENLQRKDLDFIEEAKGIQCLLDKWGMSQDRAARLLGKSQSAIANKLRLLRHSEPVLQALREGGLSERHARALLKLPTEPQKLAVIETVVRLGMSVARTEQYIEQQLAAPADSPPKPNVGMFLNGINQSLSRFQLCGIPAVSQRTDTEDKIVLTITIPKCP
jgi:ParB family chromosome partitioning protein